LNRHDKPQEITNKKLETLREAALRRRELAMSAWQKATGLEQAAETHRTTWRNLKPHLDRLNGEMEDVVSAKLLYEERLEKYARVLANDQKKTARDIQQRAIRVAHGLATQAALLRGYPAGNQAERTRLGRQANALDEIATLNRWELDSRQRQNLPRASLDGTERTTQSIHGPGRRRR
jgi:hypothetical protein